MSNIVLKKKNDRKIEEGLFGLNLEITRKTFFGGLSMQLLNNRKFYAHDNDSCPSGWICKKCTYVTDKPEKSMCESNFLIMNDGAGITTEYKIHLEKGREYELLIWLSTPQKCTINVAVGDYNFIFDAVKCSEPYILIKHIFHITDDVDDAFTINVQKGEVSIYQVSLMDADNFYGMNKEVIELLKMLKGTYLRFPGGCCTDHFNWRESIKPRELRKPIDGKVKWFLFPDTYGQDAYDIGLNEFMMLCKEVGAEPEYTVRLVLSTPEEAHDLVEYCNGEKITKWGGIRESLGYAKFNIKNWYIGNEIYYFGYGLENDGKLAAEMTDKYIEYMKRADPNIKVIVGACGDGHHDEWDALYFENLKSDIDYISFHGYCGTAIDSDKTDKLTCSNIQKLGLNGKMERLDFLKFKLFEKNWDNIKINIDEWNLTWGSKGNNLMLMADALMFHFMVNSGEYYHITDARFFHPVNEGMITVVKGKVEMDLIGSLFVHLNGHKGGKVIEKVCDDAYNPDTLFTFHNDHIYGSLINRSEKTLNFNIEINSELLSPGYLVNTTSLLMDTLSGLSNNVTNTNESYTTENGLLKISMKPYEILFIKIIRR